MGKLFGALAIMAAAFVSVPVLVLLQAWVGHTIWNWHMVRLGVPTIGMGTAIGVSCLVSLWAHQRQPNPDKNKSKNLGELVVELVGLVGGRAIGMLFLMLVAHWAR